MVVAEKPEAVLRIAAETLHDGFHLVQDARLQVGRALKDIVLLAQAVQGVDPAHPRAVRLEGGEFGLQVLRGGQVTFVLGLLFRQEAFRLDLPGPEIEYQRRQDARDEEREHAETAARALDVARDGAGLAERNHSAAVSAYRSLDRAHELPRPHPLHGRTVRLEIQAGALQRGFGGIVQEIIRAVKRFGGQEIVLRLLPLADQIDPGNPVQDIQGAVRMVLDHPLRRPQCRIPLPARKREKEQKQVCEPEFHRSQDMQKPHPYFFTTSNWSTPRWRRSVRSSSETATWYLLDFSWIR